MLPFGRFYQTAEFPLGDKSMSIIHYPDFETVKAKIELSLRILYKNDFFLVTNTVIERSINHKLVEYIQQ